MNDDVRPPAPDKAAALAVVTVLAYMLARYFLYAAMPATSFGAWFVRDLVMTLPRMAAFGACLLIAAKTGGWRRWGWHTGLTGAGTSVLGLATAMECVGHASRGSGSTLYASDMALGWAATGAVALFEEAAFRSLLYLTLRPRLAPLPAALLSSVAFVFYHVQAQPLALSWPHMLAFGLAACAALERGMGLVWLIAAHWLADGAWYHLSGLDPGAPWAMTAYPGLITATDAVAVYLLWRTPPQREAA